MTDFVVRVIRAATLAGVLAMALAAAGCANRPNDPSAGAGSAPPGSQQDFVVNVGDRVFFESDSSELTPQSTATLEKQAQWLQIYNQYTFTVEGHADERCQPDADDFLRQGTPGRGLQRHLVLVAEPPRGHGAQYQLISGGTRGKGTAGAFGRRLCFGAAKSVFHFHT